MWNDKQGQPAAGASLIIERSVIIQRPIEQVFAFVANFANEPRYNRALRSVRMISPGDGMMGVGAQWQEVVWLAGTHTRTVTAFASNSVVAYRNDGRPVAVENTFRFEQTPGGVRLTASSQVRLAGGVVMCAPVFRLLLPALVGRVLSAIQQALESGAARDGDEG